MKKIVIILDGLADPNKKTPLEVAKTPNLDFLAKNGKTGLMYPIKGIAPESGAAQFVLLGQQLKKYPGRGIVEALGAGIKIKKNHTYFRCNFAKIKNKKILDVRKQISKKGIIKKLNKIDKDIKIIPTIGYRAIMEIKGNFTKIPNTHPGYRKYKNFSIAITGKNKLKTIKNKKINNFIKKVEKILKNTTILIRGGSNKLPKLKRLNWNLIADMPVEIGLGKLLGMKILKREKNEVKQIIRCKNDVYIQIKGPDSYGHRGDFNGKVKAIEKIDKTLKPLTKIKNAIICITSDHATPCSLKRHSSDPVPILIYNKSKDKVNKFSERACKGGALGIFEGKTIMKII